MKPGRVAAMEVAEAAVEAVVVVTTAVVATKAVVVAVVVVEAAAVEAVAAVEDVEVEEAVAAVVEEAEEETATITKFYSMWASKDDENAGCTFVNGRVNTVVIDDTVTGSSGACFDLE
jgi:hypothetical protein